ncbi:MAG: DUF1638 domain-containing protein [Chloroflexota bacterium]
MKRAVIACKVLEAELRHLLPPDVELRVLDQGLHRTPELLKQNIQKEIDSLDSDEILLGYGRCGNGVNGVRSNRARLVIPKVDDCIAILLGSYDRYLSEFSKEPGTYWLSTGWVKNPFDPYTEYHRCIEKYGETTARWIAGEMMKGYKRLVFIDTCNGDTDESRHYAQRFAAFFGLNYEEKQGSDALLRGLISNDRRDRQFLVVAPGEEVTLDKFLPNLSMVNA